MKSIGDAAAGFSAVFDAERLAIRVRGWGFWSADVCGAFATTVSEVCSASPKGSSLLMDMTDLKPLRDEGQRAFGLLIGQLRQLGVGSTSVTTSSHLTKLQLLRLVAENGMKDSVQFKTAETAPAGETPTGTIQKERTNR